MKKRINSENYYNKYQYLIWIDKKGFIDLDQFSIEELKTFASSIQDEMQKRDGTEDDVEELITNKS